MSIDKEKNFQKKIALEAYSSYIENADSTRKWLLQNGYQKEIAAIEFTDSENDIQRILEIRNLTKQLTSVRKLLYTVSSQNQPSTGQPMSEEQFYRVMGWESSNDERERECRNESSELPDSDL